MIHRPVGRFFCSRSCHYRGWQLMLLGVLTLVLWPSMGLAEEDEKKTDLLLGFGETAAYRGCLMMTALNYTQGPGNLNPNGWVTLSVENRCRHSVGAIRAALVLVDRGGRPSGVDLWVLEPGMMLRPGATWQDRYAVPIGAGHIAEQWALRVVSVEGFPRRRR